MNDQRTLIKELIRIGVLRTPSIIVAFEHVDRKDFVPLERRVFSYQDDALAIGYGQTISQPLTVVFMLELLAPQKGEKILDLGSGSGWTTALLADVVGPSGMVAGVERIPELVTFGKENLAKYNYGQAKIAKAGDELGFSEEAPFDRILVSAAAAKLPRPLVDQLKVGGVMVIPVGNAIQKVTKLSGEEVAIETYEGFEFVPLL